MNTAWLHGFISGGRLFIYWFIYLFFKFRHNRYICGVLNLIKLLMGNTFRKRKKKDTTTTTSGNNMFVCVCACAYVCTKERSGYPAYAEYSENIHNAFGEQGREKAPGIQFRMWLKASMPLRMWMCVCVCICLRVCVHMWVSVFVLALYWNTTGWLEFPLQALGVARFEPHICAPALSLLPSLSIPLSFSLWEACILRVLCYFKGRSGYVVHRVYAVQIIYLVLSRSLSKQDWVKLETL